MPKSKFNRLSSKPKKPSEFVTLVIGEASKLSKEESRKLRQAFYVEVDFIGNKLRDRSDFNFERELHTLIFECHYGFFWMHSYVKYSNEFFKTKEIAIEDAIDDLRNGG